MQIQVLPVAEKETSVFSRFISFSRKHLASDERMQHVYILISMHSNTRLVLFPEIRITEIIFRFVQPFYEMLCQQIYASYYLLTKFLIKSTSEKNSQIWILCYPDLSQNRFRSLPFRFYFKLSNPGLLIPETGCFCRRKYEF